MLQDFDVIDATLKETYGGHVSIWDRIGDKPMEPLKEAQREALISLRVKANDSSIILSTGEHLSNIDGYVEIHPQAGELRFHEGDMGIGVMAYFRERSSYYIVVRVPPAQFDDLVAAARSGRDPSRVVIEDRSRIVMDDMAWNIESESTRDFHVSSIQFSIPLAPMQPQIFQFLHHFINDSKEWGLLFHAIDKKLRWTAIMILVLGVGLLALKL